MIDNTTGDTIEAVEVLFDSSEVSFSKILWMLTTYKEGDKVVNLSWTSYLGDRNPNWKMSDYVLRNDSLVPDYKGYHEVDGFVYSDISGSIVGTERVENRPIYDLIKLRVSDLEDWSRSRRYSISDRVILGDKVYESVESDNIGNHPYYSRKWVIYYDN